ncbi:hypothetical protein ACFFRR_000438 [Megaselia abdita]
MDFNLTIVIACVLFVSFVSLLLINKFFRRKTFDEVIAEKKALADKIYGTNTKKQTRATQNVKKEAKKDKKRQQKLLQQQQDSDGQHSETQSESADNGNDLKPHIEFEPEPVILEEEPAQSLKQRKPKKADKKQGILTNKNEALAKENDSGSANQLNHFDVKPPKDAVELKKQQVKEVKEVVKEIKQQQSNESPKNLPKKKSEKKDKKEKDTHILEAEVQGVNGLMKLFSKADLNRSETQILIEFLLNKQQDMPESHSSWSDDIVPKLRKELEQAQKELIEERTSTKSIQEKLQVLRNEYNGQKNKYNDFTKKFNESLELRESEIVDLKQEIVKLNEKFNVERQQFQASLQHHREKANSSQDLLAQVQQITERNNLLQAEVMSKNQVISELEQHLNLANESVKQLNESAQNQTQQFTALEQRLRETDGVSLRLQEVEAEKESSKVEIRNLQNALDSTKSELTLAGKKLEEVSNENLKSSNAGEENVKKLKDELKNANDKLAQISTEKVQISKTMDEKYSKLEKDHKDLTKQQETFKDEIQKFKQIVSEKDNIINNFEKNSKQREEIILQQVAEQKDKNNPSGKKSSDEQKLRQLFERICPEAVKKHANSALSSPFDQWVEQVLTTHTELNKITSSCSNGDLSNNTNISNLSKSSSKANGQNEEDLEKLTTENNNLKQEGAQLRAQNEELKKLVTNTENILNNLQTKAQETDATWKDVIRAKNEEIEILKHSNGHQ